MPWHCCWVMVTSSLIFFFLSLSLSSLSQVAMAVICVLGNLFLCYFFFKYKYELSRRRRLKMTICIKNSHFLFFFLHRALEHYLLTSYFNGLQSYHLSHLCFFSVLILCHFKGFEISPVWSLWGVKAFWKGKLLVKFSFWKCNSE